MKILLYIKKKIGEEKEELIEFKIDNNNQQSFSCDHDFYQSNYFRFDLEESTPGWEVGQGENKSKKNRISLPMKENSTRQLFDGEYSGNTEFVFYKNTIRKFALKIYILPTKILNNHFQQMVKDIYTLFPNIINIGLVKHDFLLQILNRTNQLDHQIIIFKKLIDRFIYHIQSIIGKPFIKSNMVFKPFNKKSKINITILKTIYKKGYNVYSYKTQIQNTLLVPSVNIKPEIKSLKNISHCISFLIDKVDELIDKVDELLKLKGKKEYAKEARDKLAFSRKNLKGIHNLFLKFFKLPDYLKNNKIIPPPTWIESNNKNYFSIRKNIKDFDYSFAIPNVLEIGDRNLTKISELYEYWLFIKFYNSLERNIINIEYLENPNKPEMHGKIHNYSFDIIMGRKIPRAENGKVGLINSDSDAPKTPDLSIYFKINEEIKKIFIFDAKYMPESKMVAEMIKCIKKSYNSVGVVTTEGTKINLVNHFWLLYPGLYEGSKFTSKINYYEKQCHFDGDYRMTSGWLPLRPEYGDTGKGEYNVDKVLNTFLTNLFEIEGILK
ncbi:MAG: hypothetical protein H8E60_01770 [Candidatus Marinimicrobia bacterium]|nr:hypothetical protein [Candidatus Neomarinimicrobiota bacterium]